MNLRKVFVDTSAWYAVADKRDAHHTAAGQRLRELVAAHGSLFTTNHVVAESYTLVRVRLGASAAANFLRGVRDSVYTKRIFVLESWEDAAEDLLLRYHDQRLSYVDATSFVAMRHLKLDTVFAYDHHFEVVGFSTVG